MRLSSSLPPCISYQPLAATPPTTFQHITVAVIPRLPHYQPITLLIDQQEHLDMRVVL